MLKLFIAAMISTLVSVTAVAAEPDKAEQPAAGSITMDCDRPVSCSSLKSCAEACAALNQCALGKLDRDKDGIPCESMCKVKCDARG